MDLPYYYTKQTPRGSVVVFETILGPRLITDELTTKQAEALATHLNSNSLNKRIIQC